LIDKQRIRTFLIGGAAGAIAGILLAPRSGRELRGSISNRAGEARERGRESYFDVGERMRERISRTRDGSPSRTPSEEEAKFESAATVGKSPDNEELWPPLRDVSRHAPVPPASDPFAETDYEEEVIAEETPSARSEVLRRRIRETRERLGERRGQPDGGEEDPK